MHWEATKLERAKSSLGTSLAIAREENADMEDVIEAKSKEIARLKSKITEHESNWNHLTRELANKIVESGNLTAEKESLEREKKELKEEKGELTKKVARLERKRMI
jgi:chromosome segregation ATPase